MSFNKKVQLYDEPVLINKYFDFKPLSNKFSNIFNEVKVAN